MKRIIAISFLLLSWVADGESYAQPAPAAPEQPPPAVPAQQSLPPVAPSQQPAETPPPPTPEQRPEVTQLNTKLQEFKNKNKDKDKKFDEELNDKKKELEDTTDLKAAEAEAGPARPQLLAIRGGSLGFPSPAVNRGILAGVDAKIAGGADLTTKSSVDAFAKVGGVDIGKRVFAEVIGETFEADVPVITLTGMPALPVMTKTSFSSVGIRGRVNFHSTVWYRQQLADECATARAVSEVARARLKKATTNLDRKSYKALELDAQVALAAIPDCKERVEAITQSAVWSLMGGMRVVRRGGSDEGLTNLGGVQWELGLRRDSEAKVDDRYSWSIMLGLAGMHLNQADAEADGVTTRYIRLNDVRATLAAEIRKPVATDDTVTSALGVYGTLSQDFWTNKFHVGGVDKVRDYQLEGGVYVSGVMNGFSGLIMLSIIKPYAHGAENVYAVSVIPFGGATPKEKKKPDRAEPDEKPGDGKPGKGADGAQPNEGAK